MALARARELTDSVMAAINNGTDPDSHVQIFPYSGSHSFPVFGFSAGSSECKLKDPDSDIISFKEVAGACPILNGTLIPFSGPQ